MYNTPMSALPIHEVLPQIKSALAVDPSLVLQAPPGAGKTTVVPPELLNEHWLGGRSILILEPRRLAARAAADRMAALMGEKAGETVGYRIRFDSKVSSKTRIEVLTEGILTRRLQSDPGLEGVGLVIFDEFHERHLHADLALALCLDSRRQLCHDLKILVMSATMDGEGVSALLGKAPLITSEGRSFPVDVHYERHDPEDKVPETVRGAVIRAIEKTRGDILVFLPGAWEIRRTIELLEPHASRQGIGLFPLYGDLPWEAQQKAISPSKAKEPSGAPPRKIILATPIAETSLTIEGVSVVVDSGFVRVPRFDPASGLSRLVTTRISRASSEQRAGRAGRLGPGVCYRLWTKATQSGLLPRPVPEIRAADLAPLALELAGWGVREPSALNWLDTPPEGAFTGARELLNDLGALDSEGGLSPLGKQMAAMPLHPRPSHMLLEGERIGAGELAGDLAALLSERDILTKESRSSCDILTRLEAIRVFRKRGRNGAHSFGADPNACGRVDQASRQFRRLLRKKPAGSETAIEKAGVLLSFAYPDRIAGLRKTGEKKYLLSSGRGASLPGTENRLNPPYLVAASLDAGDAEGKIYLAAEIGLAELRSAMAGKIKVEEVVCWDDRTKKVSAQREEKLGELILESRGLSNPDPEKVRAAMLEGV
ncbi:MAG TPA: ATP-dependent helicase HrpB, partial [Nitrospiria bacterium]